MGDIQAILLVPEKGDPHGLLKEGVCGARPPMAISGHLCGYEEHRAWKSPEDYEYHSDCYMCSGKAALVLAWDGKPVPEGIDRLGRPPARCGVGWVREVVGVHLGTRLDDSDALTDPDLPGTIVLLDADGKEIESEIVS